MISNAMFHILVRVITKRVKDGENLQDVLDSYPTLDEETKIKIANAVILNL